MADEIKGVAGVRPTLTKDTLVKQLMTGAPLMVVEYRGTKIDEVRYVDKATGKPDHFVKVEHAVESTADGQTEAFTVEERQPKDVVTKDQVRVGLTKGQTVVLRLASLRREKGRSIASVADPSGIAVVA